MTRTGRPLRVTDEALRAANAVGMTPRQIAEHFGYDHKHKYIYLRLKRIGVVVDPYSQAKACMVCGAPILDRNRSGVCSYCHRRRRHYGAHEDLDA